METNEWGIWHLSNLQLPCNRGQWRHWQGSTSAVHVVEKYLEEVARCGYHLENTCASPCNRVLVASCELQKCKEEQQKFHFNAGNPVTIDPALGTSPDRYREVSGWWTRVTPLHPTWHFPTADIPFQKVSTVRPSDLISLYKNQGICIWHNPGDWYSRETNQRARKFLKHDSTCVQTEYNIINALLYTFQTHLTLKYPAVAVLEQFVL